MALGFKKSFFGYNCEEVSEYINKVKSENKQIVETLKQKNELNENKIKELNEKIGAAEQKTAETLESLEFYKGKYEEVKRLSENIGKLYLVARTNAKTIMDTANEAQKLSGEQLDKNISVLDEAQAAISNLRDSLETINSDFSVRTKELENTMQQVRAMADNAQKANDSMTENFNKTLNYIK